MRIEPTQPQTQTQTTFGKTAFVNGRGLGYLYKNIGNKRTDDFLNKISSAAKQIPGKEFYFLNRSQIVGDSVTLKGKYANDKSVERFAVTLNLNANQEEIQKELLKETGKLKLTNIFES